jgi:hypothetical protein
MINEFKLAKRDNDNVVNIIFNDVTHIYIYIYIHFDPRLYLKSRLNYQSHILFHYICLFILLKLILSWLVLYFREIHSKGIKNRD